VVNSSQGGGSTDTWVLAGPGTRTPEPVMRRAPVLVVERAVGPRPDPGPALAQGQQQQQGQQVQQQQQQQAAASPGRGTDAPC
jgi:hypothetical protein